MRYFQAALGLGLLLAGPAWAENRGTALSARAMLERAVAAVQEDEAEALADFTRGAPPFK